MRGVESSRGDGGSPIRGDGGGSRSDRAFECEVMAGERVRGQVSVSVVRTRCEEEASCRNDSEPRPRDKLTMVGQGGRPAPYCSHR